MKAEDCPAIFCCDLARNLFSGRRVRVCVRVCVTGVGKENTAGSVPVRDGGCLNFSLLCCRRGRKNVAQTIL